MKYRYERDMAPAVAAWLSARRLHAKPEIQLPWGCCDFVGVRFNSENVKRRLSYRQRRAVPSVLRMRLLMATPDEGTSRGMSLDEYGTVAGPWTPSDRVDSEVQQLVDGLFLVRDADGVHWKRNGWMPIGDRVVAVEMKLNRTSEALTQAAAHRAVAHASYVAMPQPDAARVAASASAASFADLGVGLLGVAAAGCSVLIEAMACPSDIDASLQAHCAERVWTSYVREL